MAELLEEVDGSRGMSRTEHALRSVLNSDIDSVRSRLIGALESLDYIVTSDQPLYARRKARGPAAYYLSSNILDYPIRLTIGLRQLGPEATLATFDYVAEHAGGISFKGDQQTLTREAEAIIALAASQGYASACTSCGTKQISEGRFCRVCGKPTIGREPAELEVLRVTAGTRAGHHLISVGAIWTAVTFLATLALIVLGFNVVGFAVGLLLTQVLTGLVILFWGMHSLSRTLNPGSRQTSVPPIDLPGELPSTDARSLPYSTPMSITEGTTSLLVPKLKARGGEPVYSKRKTTSPMD